MAGKRQEIKAVLHKPEKMDSDRCRQIEAFWIEAVLKQIEKCNLTEEELQYLREYAGSL